MSVKKALNPKGTVVVIMGVSGVGKTTLGHELAKQLDWPFQEGDDLHPEANILKMSAGVPLNDADRIPWLRKVAAWIDQRLAASESGVITCSALRRTYRDAVIEKRDQIVLVYIKGDENLIRTRLERRDGHFMSSKLLNSQFEILEPPASEEEPVVVQATDPLSEQLSAIKQALQNR